MNGSNQTEFYDNFTTTVWADYSTPGDTVMNVILAAVASYMLTVQWTYYCRKFGCNGRRESCKERKESITISIPLILTMIVTGGRVYLNEVVLKSPHQPWSSLYRAIIFILVCFSYLVSLLSTYSVLWLRQRGVHSKPALMHLSNSASRFVSKYFLGYIMLHNYSYHDCYPGFIFCDIYHCAACSIFSECTSTVGACRTSHHPDPPFIINDISVV